MAYQVTYWKMEGASDIELRASRIKRIADISRDRLIESRPMHTDIILLERSDKQSPIVKTLWHSLRYRDLNDR